MLYAQNMHNSVKVTQLSHEISFFGLKVKFLVGNDHMNIQNIGVKNCQIRIINYITINRQAILKIEQYLKNQIATGLRLA